MHVIQTHILKNSIMLVESAANYQTLEAFIYAIGYFSKFVRLSFNKLFAALPKVIFSKLTYSLCVY